MSFQDLSERVLDLLAHAKRRLWSIERLAAALAVSRAELHRALEQLMQSGEVVSARKERVALASRLGLTTGTLRITHAGRVTVQPEIPDSPILLERSSTGSAMHGDRVLVERTPYTRRGLPTGRMRRILKRANSSLVGTVAETDSGRRLLVPLDSRFGPPATISPGGLMPASGQVVSARIIEYRERGGLMVCPEKILGPAGSLPTEIEAVCNSLGISTDFPPVAEQEVMRFQAPSAVDYSNRRDLRHLLMLTIDPLDARDFDDAVAIEPCGSGFRLTVSIADVSHYVRPGTALDEEAMRRGTSVYFPGRSVPMLPERLSADLASLRPGKDRLALSVTLEVDGQGRIRRHSFTRSIVRSHFRLTYEQAQAILDRSREAPLVDRPLCETIKRLASCAVLLRAQRLAKGALELDLPELKVDVDDAGEPLGLRRQPTLAAHRIIEECMLAANGAVATTLDQKRIPFLYRIHERPSAGDLSALAASLSVFGVRLQREGGEVTPAALQAALRASEGRSYARIVHLLVLRALSLARYSAHKAIHFGLASPCYTHFTSPIRRYPDLLVHRTLTSLILDPARAAGSLRGLENLAEHCSARERLAAEAERDILRAATILFMRSYVGEAFEGTVRGVVAGGYFVELDRVSAEGFVPIGRLREYYDYIPERMELRSRTSRDAIRIGDRTSVVVTSADLAQRRLELAPGENA